MRNPQFTFRMTEELKKKAEQAAKKDRRTLAGWIKKLIEDAVEKQK